MVWLYNMVDSPAVCESVCVLMMIMSDKAFNFGFCQTCRYESDWTEPKNHINVNVVSSYHWVLFVT